MDNEQALSVQHVGGKAARLAALIRAGYPVPPGICLTTEIFKQALRPYQKTITTYLQTVDLTNIAAATKVAAQIRELLHNLTLPPTVRETLFDLLPQIMNGKTAVVVRSSATDEDSATASFAGLYATIFCRNKDTVEQAIIDCWRSFLSANALAQRAQTNSLLPDANMAVLLQPLIDADCAGVAFSIDPVTHMREDVVVNSTWGLGPGIVDGIVAADTDRVERINWHVVKRHIMPKTEQILLDTQGQLQRTAVTADHVRSACLPESWLKRIAHFAVSLEQFWEQPQDVEWAVANNQVWILQSRPLSSLPPELWQTTPFPISWQNDDHNHFWEQAHYKAHQQAVPLPLEYDHFEVQKKHVV